VLRVVEVVGGLCRLADNATFSTFADACGLALANALGRWQIAE
jgi:hypothetical protein